MLSDLISAEIADLDDRARLVLGAVATIGRETSHELLAAVVDLPEREVEAAVRTVIDARMLVVDNDAYRFRHPLLGEVVYADLLPPQRARLHRSIAATLQQQPADVLRRADRAGELAFHLDRGGRRRGRVLGAARRRRCGRDRRPGCRVRSPRARLRAVGLGRRALRDGQSRSSPVAGRRHRHLDGRQRASRATGARGVRHAVRLRSARRGATNGSGATCGPPVGCRRAASSSRRRSRCCSDDEGAAAAAVYAGLGQAELMAGHYATAEALVREGLRPRPGARRQPVGVGHGAARAGHRPQQPGRPRRSGRAVSSVGGRGRQRAGSRAGHASTCASRSAMPATHQAALNTALDAVAEGQLTGLDRGFGCYFDSLAAEALIRLGRWTEVAGVLARQPLADTLPVGLLRLARARAMLAARRGETDEALDQLAAAEAAADRRLAPDRSRRHDGRRPSRARQLGRGGAAPPSRAGLRRARPRCCGRRGSRCSGWLPRWSERSTGERAASPSTSTRRSPACSSDSTPFARSPRVCRAVRSATRQHTSRTPPPA